MYSIKKGVLKDFAKLTGKHLCQSLFLNKVVDWGPAIFFKKETLTQVYSCDVCEIFNGTPPGDCFRKVFITVFEDCEVVEDFEEDCKVDCEQLGSKHFCKISSKYA